MSRQPGGEQPPGDREIAAPVAVEPTSADGSTTPAPAPQVAAGLLEYAEQSPLAVAVVDGETRVIRYANPAFLRMRNGDGAPVTSEIVECALPRSVVARVDMLRRGVEAGRVVQSEILVDRAGEQEPARCWRMAILPVPSNGRNDFVLQMADVTSELDAQRRAGQMVENLRQVNERLLVASLREQDLREEAEAANDAKSTFMAMMSHELRTPLTAIIGYEELLADGITGPVTGPQRSQLTRIKASAAHLLTLIDEVLSLARIESGREAVQGEPIDVSALMRTAVELVAPLVASKRLTWSLLPPGHPVALTSDPVKLRQILVNLLANAVKFTEHGEIAFTVRQAGDAVIFEVRDTGIGIAPEHLERIFDAFWQVQQKSTRRVGGTGLGLHVSRRLARLLGGDITVESAPGRGSTFVLTLPPDVSVSPTAGG